MLAATMTRQRNEVDVSDEIREAFADYAAYDAKLERKYGRHAEWDALPGEKAARQRKFNRFYKLAQAAGHNASQLTAKLTNS